MKALDVLRLCAGLQLLPQNAAQLPGLERAARHAATAGAADRALEWWLREAEGEADATLPGLFCVEVVLDSGGYRVFPGTHADEHWTIETLLQSAARHDDLPADFEAELLARSQAVLRLSEALAARVGVRRNTPPQHRAGAPVRLPGGDALATLVEAVVFHGSDLEQLVGSDWRTLLDPLIAVVDVDAAGRAEGQIRVAAPEELRWRPLIESPDGLTVSAPDQLCQALRHWAISTALERDLGEALSIAFLRGSMTLATDMLGRFGAMPLSLHPGESRMTFSRSERLFALDLDKELHLLVLGDELRDYDSGDPDHAWQGPSDEDLETRLREVATARFSSEQAPNELLHMVLVQGMGRPAPRTVGPADDLGALRLVLSVSDLEALSAWEDLDPQVLWGFARAAAEVRDRVPIESSSTVDEWVYWRRNRRSFALLELGVAYGTSDGSIGGEAPSMRVEGAVKRDRHAALHAGGLWVPVLSHYEDLEIPVAEAEGGATSTGALLIEGLPLAVWAVPAEPGTRFTQAQMEGHARWTDLIAYWLWQLSPSLERLWAELAPLGAVTVAVSLTERGGGAPWRVGRQGADMVVVDVYPEASIALFGDDNAGERLLIGAVVEELVQLAPATGGEPLDGAALRRALDRHMSPPGKRRLVPVANGGPGYEPTAFPERYLSEIEIARAKAEVGRAVAPDLRIRAGPVPRERAQPFLNAAVAALYARFEQTVASLRPSGLLEAAISLHERLLHEETAVLGRIAIDRSTFGENAPYVRRRAALESKAHLTALASRFLIEYVAARPPRGQRRFSYEVYDRLLAIASMIARFGSASDFLDAGVGAITIVVMPSGEVLERRGEIGAAADRFADASLRGDVTRSQRWRPYPGDGGELPDGDPAAGPDLGELDAAMVAETGYGLTELLRTLSTLGRPAAPDGGAIVLSLEEAVGRLQDRFGWSGERAAGAIEYFCLAPREDFATPPPGFAKRDLWPWRSNRRLSYGRRPLVMRPAADGGEPELVFGSRQLYDTSLDLYGLIVDGRLEATSKEMLHCMARAQAKESDWFNDRVADAYRAASRHVVARFEKVAGSRLCDRSGAPLGDVDVLVADLPSRTLLCVEAKRLTGPSTPHQLRNQIERTFADAGKKRSHARRHLRRVARVEELKAAVLAQLGIEGDPRRWNCLPLMVTDVALLASFASTAPLPVRSYEQITEALADGRLY